MSSNTCSPINQLKEQAVSRWESVSDTDTWPALPSYNYWQKRANEKYLQAAADALLAIIKPLTPADFQSEAVQKQLVDFFGAAIEKCPFLSKEEKAYLCNCTQLSASKAFLDQFLTEDANLTLENLGQAMRNFWIANLLQACFGKPIENTQALYGYSMLYPYTDNLMDSLTSSKEEKSAFCKRLTRHLQGSSQSAQSDEEARIFQLVDKIYASYPIKDFPSVSMGLLAIHDAQSQSLKQQAKLLPYEVDLLGKSFLKGGTSLLADGLLVKPDMSQEEQQFCFDFGAILQLCDDLQDMESDYQSQHQTLFSQLKSCYALDPLLKRLNGFLEINLNQLANLSTASAFDLPLVIGKNTRMLLLFAALDHERAFTKPFVIEAYSRLPIRPKALKKLAKQFRREMKGMALISSSSASAPYMDRSVADLKKDLTTSS